MTEFKNIGIKFWAHKLTDEQIKDLQGVCDAIMTQSISPDYLWIDEEELEKLSQPLKCCATCRFWLITLCSKSGCIDFKGWKERLKSP